MKKFICIEGNIGVGKSTLARRISKECGYLYLPEEFEENPLLPLFYKEPDKYAFSLEISFLLDRFRQLSNWKNKLSEFPVVSDYFFEKCLYFAEINLNPEKYLLFKEQFEQLNRQVIQPDLLIVLKLSTELLQENIRNRNRDYETQIEDTYLEKLNTIYERVVQYKKETAIVTFVLPNNNALTYESIFTEVKGILNREIPAQSKIVTL